MRKPSVMIETVPKFVMMMQFAIGITLPADDSSQLMCRRLGMKYNSERIEHEVEFELLHPLAHFFGKARTQHQDGRRIIYLFG